MVFDDPRLHELAGSVTKAGEILLSYWPGSSSRRLSAEISEKSDGSLVSTADMKSNELLSADIARLFPDDLLFSEETAIDPERVRQSRRTWIIDPLDGTNAFLAGRDDFAILVGLCELYRPTVGMMYFPARGEFASASEGRGATRNGTPLHVSSSPQCRPHGAYVRNFECTRPEIVSPSMDSSLALLYVACGELDAAVIRMSTHREWDIAAPSALIREAGGMITDETGADIRCGLGEVSFQYFVASNRYVHQEILRLINK